MQEILRKKLQEFKNQHNINDYDLGLEIGLSQYTIYQFRKGRNILPHNLDKISEFLDTYVTPEQKLNKAMRDVEAYKQTLQEIKEIAEKEFNKKLKDKDCFDCDESFKQIINKIREVLDER